MKSIIRKGIIPARTQSQDKKFQISRPCDVYEGRVRSQHLLFVQVSLEVSNCRVTQENCYKSSVFFNEV